MKTSIFDHQDYKKYVRDWIATQPKKGRGIRSRLAVAVSCRVAYISQVLNGDLHFSLEQAGRVNRFFSHTKDESHFFLLLVQHARAGDQETRRYFKEQLEAELARRLVLTTRLGFAQGISAEDQVTYYSAWFYSAVHILVTIPAYQTKAAIATKLGLSPTLVAEVLEFLLRTGLVKQQGERYGIGQAQIHLDQNSKLTARSHANWRVRMLPALDLPRENDVHYTGVVSLAAEDARKLKARILEQIEEILAVVKDSREEQLAAFCVDFVTI